MPGSGRSVLGDLERAIMDQLWDRRAGAAHGLSVREVHDVVGADRGLAYTTVMTVLNRLSKKGLVTRERDGRAWRYLPAQSLGSLTADSLHATLGALAGTERKAALHAFLAGSTPAELTELRQALDEVQGALTRSDGRRRGVTRRVRTTGVPRHAD